MAIKLMHRGREQQPNITLIQMSDLREAPPSNLDFPLPPLERMKLPSATERAIHVITVGQQTPAIINLRDVLVWFRDRLRPHLGGADGVRVVREDGFDPDTGNGFTESYVYLKGGDTLKVVDG